MIAGMYPGGMPGAGGPADMVLDLPKPPEPVPMQRIDFDAWNEEDEKRVDDEDVAKLRKTIRAPAHERVDYEHDPTWCFWCLCTQRIIDISTDNDHMHKLKLYLEENWQLIERRSLMRKAQETYNLELRFWMVDADTQRPWSMECIYRHFTEHEQAGRFQLEESLADLNEMCRIQGRARIKLKDPETGKLSLDHKEANMFMKLLGSRRALMNDIDKFRPDAVI